MKEEHNKKKTKKKNNDESLNFAFIQNQTTSINMLQYVNGKFSLP